MRRRTLTVALSAVVLAVVLLGVPLGVVLWHNAVTEERGELERAALRAATAVSPRYTQGDPVELPASPTSISVAVYSPDGRRIAGTGPATMVPGARPAAHGRVVDADDAGHLREAVPITVGERVIGVVVASSPRSALHATVARDFAELAGLAVLALLGAGAFAYWQARRLSGPMRDLAAAATALGAGDYSARAPASGVPEIDRTAAELAAAGQRIATHLEHERAFAAQASHQLRTPLTRLRLELESGLGGDRVTLEASAREALETADHLSRTIDDVLALAHNDGAPGAVFDVEPVLAELVEHWRGTFALDDRPLRLVAAPLRASGSAAAVRQVLHVLVDNAYRHGRGVVTVTARESNGAVAIDVSDRGTDPVPWPPDRTEDGRLGLAMARRLAEAQRGRLLLDAGEQGTRFTLLVPGAAEPDPGQPPVGSRRTKQAPGPRSS